MTTPPPHQPHGWNPPRQAQPQAWGQQHQPHPPQQPGWGQPQQPQPGWGPPGQGQQSQPQPPHPGQAPWQRGQQQPPPHYQHPQQQFWPEPQRADSPPSVGVLLGTTAWRLGIGSLALYYAQTGKEETMSSESLSYLSNVGVGIGFLALAVYPLFVGGRRHEPKTGWLRGALTILMLLVGLVFIVGMGGEPDGPHAVIPALVTIDWLFVGRNQFRTRAWEPLTWIAFPLLYLAYHKSNDLGLYEDILGDENFATMVPAFLVGCIVLGYLLYGAALVRRAASRAGR